ncbi:MAG TPA: molybdopterin molybdenumtransferase MoeA, partial [Burkholderiaceae bacterium]|nr:molybdopterin molybdenumtransferase MoeA [Burkholderiaceae bacterium]
MLTVEEALSRLLSGAQPLAGVEDVDTFEAAGRVLARPLAASIAVPPLANSQMDGYAVRSADVASAGTRLRVTQRIPAGQIGSAVAPGTAARIFTGAPVPPGCDAIVMQEAATLDGDVVTINEVSKPG